MEKMAKSKTQYRCSKEDCGHVTPKWEGKCSRCGAWGSLVEEEVNNAKAVNPATQRRQLSGNNTKSKAVRLKDVQVTKDSRIMVKDKEFNRVMGGGIVKDSVTIITAPPGTGKSTLLLMIADELGSMDYTVYYATGEESSTQIRERSQRVAPNLSDNVWIHSETNVNNIIDNINEVDADIVIIDSIQTMYAEELTSRAGSPTQIDESITRFIDSAKNPERKRAYFIVAHMTKEDELAGNRTLEHAVDAVLYLEGDRTQQLRLLYCKKNRFGEAGETGLYSMLEKGLIPIDNPSEFFMTKRDVPVAGSALTVTREGTRNIVIEIESLCEKTLFGYPTRVAEGINLQQLKIMTAIVERSRVRLSDKDVYVKVTAGMKPKETSVNLGIAMSIVSSVYKKGIPTDTVFIGEVGLTGEIKSVPYMETRIKELDRLGFKKAYIPKGNLREPVRTTNLKVVEVAKLDDVIEKIYPIKDFGEG